MLTFGVIGNNFPNSQEFLINFEGEGSSLLSIIGSGFEELRKSIVE